jgi:uncharacterized protein YbbK (DUF523 family)
MSGIRHRALEFLGRPSAWFSDLTNKTSATLNGVDVTERLLEFTESFFFGLERVDGFILKSASPTCGIKDVKVYPGEGKVASSGRDSGFFGGIVLERYCGLPKRRGKTF